MLPPVDPHVLEQNPHFGALYKDLTTTKLNQDGTTINHKDEARQAEIRSQLFEIRERLARTRILREALLSFASKSSDLPDELQEVIVLLLSESENEIRIQAEELLRDDKQYFLENIDLITSTLTTHLATLVPPIAALLSPEDPSIQTLTTLPPPSTHPIPHPTSLPPTTLPLATHTTALQTAHTTLFPALITHLERTIHGQSARHARAEAEHLGCVARAMELKARVLEGGRGDAEVEEALKAYERHLGRVERGLGGRVEALKGELGGYEGKGMNGVVERYVEVVREVEEVRREVEELEGRVKG
ncbi:hypothetical protein P152DRAFT_485593 [Eremomyces bilateralis CBS 781.70]|uniref:Uncharacterized protein n=1 Tax=Eremomyces bilateralis CBS 781.70 TaxID=1392243 RepID=A0A6G1FR26_9PEZI|nr:uncharacterized protein P152DRAFT_485593 [Eremomyces bilateralis CBS 781.70]KAF1808227.1 hypothetical protein P152DRAFT_485593 [Eremomyces bilateralis CBS 781.70]